MSSSRRSVSSKPIIPSESLSYIQHHLKIARTSRSSADLELAAREIAQIMRYTGSFPILLDLHVAISRAQIVANAVSGLDAGGDAIDGAVAVCWKQLRRLAKGAEVI